MPFLYNRKSRTFCFLASRKKPGDVPRQAAGTPSGIPGTCRSLPDGSAGCGGQGRLEAEGAQSSSSMGGETASAVGASWHVGIAEKPSVPRGSHFWCHGVPWLTIRKMMPRTGPWSALPKESRGICRWLRERNREPAHLATCAAPVLERYDAPE